MDGVALFEVEKVVKAVLGNAAVRRGTRMGECDCETSLILVEMQGNRRSVSSESEERSGAELGKVAVSVLESLRSSRMSDHGLGETTHSRDG